MAEHKQEASINDDAVRFYILDYPFGMWAKPSEAEQLIAQYHERERQSEHDKAKHQTELLAKQWEQSQEKA